MGIASRVRYSRGISKFLTLLCDHNASEEIVRFLEHSHAAGKRRRQTAGHKHTSSVFVIFAVHLILWYDNRVIKKFLKMWI